LALNILDLTYDVTYCSRPTKLQYGQGIIYFSTGGV